MTENNLDAELDRMGRAAVDYLTGVILALAVFALAVFALPITVGVLAAGRGDFELLGGLVVECLLTTVALVRFVDVRREDRTVGSTLRLLAGAAFAAWGVAFLALILVLADRMSSSQCTGDGAGLAGEIGAVVIYATAGGWALTPRRSAPIAVLALAAAALIGVIFAGVVWHYGPAMPGCYND